MHTASSERMKMKISWSASVFLLKPTKHVELNSCLLAVQSTLDTIILLFLVHFDFDDNSREWKSLLDGTSAWTLHQGCTKTSSTRPCDDISRGGIMNTCLFPSFFCLLFVAVVVVFASDSFQLYLLTFFHSSTDTSPFTIVFRFTNLERAIFHSALKRWMACVWKDFIFL